MYSFPILLISFPLITITHSEYVIGGEKTRYSLFCSTSNALWVGPGNQTILANSEKYQMKYSFDSVKLTIDHLTAIDEGEYLCFHNETNEIIQRYELKIGTIRTVLLLFSLLIGAILLLLPVFWYFGYKYSGIDR